MAAGIVLPKDISTETVLNYIIMNTETRAANTAGKLDVASLMKQNVAKFNKTPVGNSMSIFQINEDDSVLILFDKVGNKTCQIIIDTGSCATSMYWHGTCRIINPEKTYSWNHQFWY